MSYYNICKYCGAYLDPCEKCDCDAFLDPCKKCDRDSIKDTPCESCTYKTYRLTNSDKPQPLKTPGLYIVK